LERYLDKSGKNSRKGGCVNDLVVTLKPGMLLSGSGEPARKKVNKWHKSLGKPGWQQAVIFLIDHGLTIAAAVFQRRAVEHRDASA
jgi:hypothetical protein